MNMDNPLHTTQGGYWLLVDIVCPVCGKAACVSRDTAYRDRGRDNNCLALMCSYTCFRRYQAAKAAAKKPDGRTLRKAWPPIAQMKGKITRVNKLRRQYERELKSPAVQGDPARKARLLELIERHRQKAADYEKELAALKARQPVGTAREEHAG